jgi:hypothetical protein
MEMPLGGIPGVHRSLIQRMIGAALLDASVYEEVEADRGATGQAAAVVAIVAVCSAIGNMGQGGARGPLTALVLAFVSWLIWAGLTYVVGTKLFGGTADMGEMLRTLGFAQSPGVLAVIGLIPFLGRLAVFLVGIWILVAAVVAIRQALDFDTVKAVATAVIAWLVVMCVTIVFAIFVAGTALAARAVTGG